MTSRWTEKNSNGEPIWLWAGMCAVLAVLGIAGIYFIVAPALK